MMHSKFKVIGLWVICLGMLSISLLFSPSALARRVRGDEGKDLYDRIRNATFECLSYGYNSETLEPVARSLADLFPSLEDLENIDNLEDRIDALAKLIKDKISYKTRIFELSEVVKTGKANCLGYTQLVMVLGKVIGLNVSAMVVFSDDWTNENHIANRIQLSDSEYIILDLAGKEDSYYIMSPVFNWDENYEKGINLYFQKGESSLDSLDKSYSLVQVVDARGIAAGLDNSRGNSHLALDLYQEAIEDFNSAIYYNSSYSHPFYNRGRTYARLGSHQQAIKDYDRAIELNPFSANSYFMRGKSHAILREPQKAINDYTRAIELNPNDAEYHYERGSLRCALGSHREAIEDYNRAIALNPEKAEYYHRRGEVKHALERIEEALKDFRRAVELNPDIYRLLPADMQVLLMPYIYPSP